MDEFDKAVKKAMTPKGAKALEKRIEANHEENSALYTIQQHARTELELRKARKLINSGKRIY